MSEPSEDKNLKIPSSGGFAKNLSLRVFLFSVIVAIICILTTQESFTGPLTEYIVVLRKYYNFSGRECEGSSQEFPTYAIYRKSNSEHYLAHVIDLLHQMGYKRVEVGENWDLLWAHDYPFRKFSNQFKDLKGYKRVNHIPGSGYLTYKVELATTGMPFIPKAFKLPTDKEAFLQYSEKHPEKLFVEKHNEHRHIAIRSGSEINLRSNSTFLQEFINDPYLVDGYKFDVGIYVIITSVDPLRVYLYKGDVLFRYCTIKYYPFEKEIIEKYVVGDDYLPTWELPSLSYYFNELKFNMKDSFDAYVRQHNDEPEIIWEQVEEMVRTAILFQYPKILESAKKYRSTKNFFELMRFDFIIDKNLRVYLMEANMSPNLSSAHFKKNSLLYKQILYSLLNLVGIGSPLKSRKRALNQNFISSYKNIVVEQEICANKTCRESCSPEQCEICAPCLTKENLDAISTAYEEHIHKADTKRLFPKPIKNLDDFNLAEELKGMNARNKFMTRWFYGKCKTDVTWCI